jgi:hypothetical protein
MLNTRPMENWLLHNDAGKLKIDETVAAESADGCHDRVSTDRRMCA